ncbi:hypothetical protein [Subtercola vilae]|uniref:Uncharacterized protein n=1 Tax=Subtercola vilae TaxID=2056433 RepID=A0A4T2C1G8_9MICO|nr:hypothetical protein [Subtercola vilae]TIH36146.1 hypothetical protein D4765_10190 [Subtercola vilae]
MSKPRSLAKTAVAANVMVWFGAAAFIFALAGEQTWSAFHGQWHNILGWALICGVGAAISIVGIIEIRRLRARLPR